MSHEHGAPTGKRTLVEEGTELKGTITSSVPIVVMGKVEGEITGPEIEVTASGVVAGRVKVKHLRSSGELAGEVDAEAVKISGRVRDRTVIRARSLEVTLNHKAMEVVFGDCELAVGDEPGKEAAIAAATATEKPAPAAEPAPAPEAVAKKEKDIGKRTARASEAWDPAAAAPEPEPVGEPKRKRGTVPPPS